MRWLAALLLLVGCSATPEPSTPPVAPVTPAEMPTPEKPPKDPKRYASLESIYAELECDSTDVIGVGNNQATLKDMGHCFQPWASLDVYLTRYGMSNAWSHMTTYEPGVVGPNWVILAGTEQAAEVVQGLIGGEVLGP